LSSSQLYTYIDDNYDGYDELLSNLGLMVTMMIMNDEGGCDCGVAHGNDGYCMLQPW
jgi:hypothetical protein